MITSPNQRIFIECFNNSNRLVCLDVSSIKSIYFVNENKTCVNTENYSYYVKRSYDSVIKDLNLNVIEHDKTGLNMT